MSRETVEPNQDQAAKLAELGDQLRQAREQSNLTIEQVSKTTMIQTRLLKAIESGKLAQLPEPIYIRGFLKRYADVLGLDGTKLSNTFPTDVGIRGVQPSWKDTPAAQLRPIHLYVAYILVIIAAVSGLAYLLNPAAPWGNRTTVSNSPSPQASAPSASAVPSATSSTSAAASPSPTALAPDKPVRVDVSLTSQSWLRVEIDGKTDFEGILPEGTQRTWTAENQVTVRAGNAGAVMVAYNNGTPTRLGDPGSVKEVTFSAEQQAASLAESPSPAVFASPSPVSSSSPSPN
ncbi:MAG TPA: RodZ domain-containing protein [Chroococcidiopsis sp.]